MSNKNKILFKKKLNHEIVGFLFGLIFPLLFLSLLSLFWKEFYHLNLRFLIETKMWKSLSVSTLSWIVLANMLPFYFLDYYQWHNAKNGLLLSVLLVYLPILLYFKFS